MTGNSLQTCLTLVLFCSDLCHSPAAKRWIDFSGFFPDQIIWYKTLSFSTSMHCDSIMQWGTQSWRDGKLQQHVIKCHASCHDSELNHKFGTYSRAQSQWPAGHTCGYIFNNCVPKKSCVVALACLKIPELSATEIITTQLCFLTWPSSCTSTKLDTKRKLELINSIVGMTHSGSKQ